MISVNDLLVILPELYLTAAACLVLLFDVFINDDQRDATHWVATIVMVVAIFLVIHGQTPPSQRSAACSCATTWPRS